MHTTNIVLLSLALMLLGIEITLIITKKPTISEGLWLLQRVHPWIAFFFGVLVGHLFWCPCAVQ